MMNGAVRTPWYARWLDQTGGRRAVLIRTQRLLLRPPRFRDAPQFHQYASDPKVSRYVLWDTHTSLSQSRTVLRGMMARSRLEGLLTFAIVTGDGGRMVGTIGLVWRDTQNSSAEVGFSLARDCWGKGLMTEALTAFLRYVFEELPVNRIEAQHDTRNPASGRVMQKAGMRSEGLLRSRLYYKGEYADVAMYAALRGEWMAAHPSAASGG